MARLLRIVIAVAAIMALVVVGGCGSKEPEALSPVVAAPAIGTDGVLKAGVDLTSPPFGGVDEGREAGIDVDVAAALAEKLGLELEIVDVKPSDVATALAAGEVDVVLSVPFADTAKSGITAAGTYLMDAPGFFAATEGTAAVETTVTLDNLSAEKVAVQEGSPAYWALTYELGEGAIEKSPSLRAALTSLAEGKVPMVAGDALVGSYIARDIPGVRYAGQVSPAEPLAIAVSEQNTTLADAVRRALDELAADGVLSTIRNKWVGGLPALEGLDSTATP